MLKLGQFTTHCTGDEEA